MSELRARMLRDMTVRGFSARTHEAYVRQVVGLARHYRRSPDQLSADEVQAYIALLFRERKRSWSTCAQDVHCVVTGGALARDGTRWIPARPGFLFPVLALAKVFRGRYLAGLRRAFDRGELHLTGGLATLAEPAAFAAWLAELRAQSWVVYCKPPFAGPEHVLAYLGRYTHRVALSNDRLLGAADGRVRFRWRDYADGDRIKVMALAVDEFLRRFLLHVVPDGFVRIRHFGLLANRRRAAALAQCRVLLTQPPPPVEQPESVRDLMLRVTGLDIERCPICQQGRLQPVERLAPAPAGWDTS